RHEDFLCFSLFFHAHEDVSVAPGGRARLSTAHCRLRRAPRLRLRKRAPRERQASCPSHCRLPTCPVSTQSGIAFFLGLMRMPALHERHLREARSLPKSSTENSWYQTFRKSMRVRPGALLGNRRRCQNSLVENPAQPRPAGLDHGRSGRGAEKGKELKGSRHKGTRQTDVLSRGPSKPKAGMKKQSKESKRNEKTGHAGKGRRRTPMARWFVDRPHERGIPSVSLRRLLPEARFVGCPDWEVSGCTDDHRRLDPGQVFVATRNPRYDGHAFVGEALDRGAAGVIVEEACEAAGRL